MMEIKWGQERRVSSHNAEKTKNQEQLLTKLIGEKMCRRGRNRINEPNADSRIRPTNPKLNQPQSGAIY
ncbi:hypothetical protein [Yersinia rohdei]|uniref:hypothetical protein n=1 Tax=Yersinia rohdei TaxID=29485 RepID=UPI0005191B93|nr:hypothetical protein [Yersinia rohdei]